MNAEAGHTPKLRGEPVSQLPEDLYIPPDALEVFLEAFEGPLDLLLYLIRKQNLDIVDIPVLRIAQQYMEYIDLMQELKIELAGEYLLMATMLAEIKSRMLLPKPEVEEEEGMDPRADLVRRLLEFERFKEAAENLDEMPRVGRDLYVAHSKPEKVAVVEQLPQPGIKDLVLAFREAMLRAEMFSSHQVEREPLSVRERMSQILSVLQERQQATFYMLFPQDEGRMGVVVTFIAILELVKGSVLQVKQPEPFADVIVRVAGAGGGVENMDITATEE
ncbi:MAG: segregation and condensation protein A [Nevskiales bacterium]